MSMVEKLQQGVMRVNKATGAVEAPKKERKNYLILAIFNDTTDGERDWHWIEGRDEAAEFLFEQIETFDALQSHVMSETQAPDRAVSIYTFLRFCMDEEKVSEEMLDRVDYDTEALLEFMQNYYQHEDGKPYTREELDRIYQDELEQ